MTTAELKRKLREKEDEIVALKEEIARAESIYCGNFPIRCKAGVMNIVPSKVGKGEQSPYEWRMLTEYNGLKIMIPDEKLARRLCEFFDYCYKAGRLSVEWEIGPMKGTNE